MLRRLILIASVIALAGCVSTKTVPVSERQLEKLQSGTVVASKRDKSDFAAFTAGKAMFGLIGAAAMISAGNRIITENNVEDPAGYIAAKLVEDLMRAHTLKVVDAGEVIASGTDVKKLAAQYSKADLLLDVQTVNWSFTYFPTDFNNYRVIYSSKLRLIDTKQGKLMAEGFCARVPEKTPEAPSRDELLADNAARLKKELMTAADYCIGEFRSKVLASNQPQ